MAETSSFIYSSLVTTIVFLTHWCLFHFSLFQKQVHKKLCHLAKTSTENTKSLEKLADRVQDFAFDLLNQVKTIEQMNIKDDDADRYASLFSGMTDNAIAKGQKKVRYCCITFKRS